MTISLSLSDFCGNVFYLMSTNRFYFKGKRFKQQSFANLALKMGEFTYDGAVTPWQATMGDCIASESELAKIMMPWAFQSSWAALTECFWADPMMPEMLTKHKDVIAWLCVQYLQNNEVKGNLIDCVVKTVNWKYYGKTNKTRYTATTAGGKSLVWFKGGKPEPLTFRPFHLEGRVQKKQVWNNKTSYILKGVDLFPEETWDDL
tara:strand:- start:419 stop:1030 length:612 start_codon:yes stop_codon:yes gene_type:complete